MNACQTKFDAQTRAVNVRCVELMLCIAKLMTRSSLVHAIHLVFHHVINVGIVRQLNHHPVFSSIRRHRGL